MDQFFLTLSSNSSMKVFGDNKTSHYRTLLPNKIELNGSYEVALMEVSYPFTFLHFAGGQEMFSVVFHSGRQIDIPLPHRYFNSPEDLLYHLNDVLDVSLHLTLTSEGYCSFHYASEHAIVDPNDKTPFAVRVRRVRKRGPGSPFSDPTDHVESVQMTPNLAAILGFMERVIVSGDIGKRAVNLHLGLPQQLFYYCDVVEGQWVGDTIAPLLRVVNTKIKQCIYGSTCTMSFTNPFYIPVLKRHFESIEILIKDDKGLNPSFSHGTSTCVLHFRRRRS